MTDTDTSGPHSGRATGVHGRASAGPGTDAARSTPSGSWPDLDGLPGVADWVERARTAVIAVRQLPANRRGWARTSAAASVRAARASAVLDGGSAGLGEISALGEVSSALGEASSVAGEASAGLEILTAAPDRGRAAHESARVTDPVLAGALRAASEIGGLAAVWRRAPMQALARLHTLAAADLAGAEQLGRPRIQPGVGDRLASLAQVVTQAPWSGPVTVAVVHGELLALRPFGTADGVIARAAARLTMIVTGLDPQALTVPEVGHLRAGADYPRAAAGFAAGGPDGLAGWIHHVCAALESGAREARSIAAAAG